MRIPSDLTKTQPLFRLVARFLQRMNSLCCNICSGGAAADAFAMIDEARLPKKWQLDETLVFSTLYNLVFTR